MTYRDEDDDYRPDGLDHELPDQADMDEDEEDPTVPCPKCRKPIHEDTEICHHCGEFNEDGSPRPVSLGLAIVVALLLVAMVGYLWWGR